MGKNIVRNHAYRVVPRYITDYLNVSFSHCYLQARALLLETLQVYAVLLRIMVPALIIVKVLQELGALDLMGLALGPAMAMAGLPAVLGIVWATTLLTNMFTGIIVFYDIAAGLSLSVEQVTVLGTMMLVAHSIPIEGAVARRAGVPWWVTIALRVGGALLLGIGLHLIYSHFQLLQEPLVQVWQPTVSDGSLLSWVLGQVQALAMVFLVILLLMLLLKVLRFVGLERLIHIALTPLLRLFGLGRSAANVTVIGVALGLTYGAGLLIRDLDEGVLSRRDAYISLCFLGLLHSLIEDTLLIMALGANLSGILWARLIFGVVVIAILARFMPSRGLDVVGSAAA